MTPQHRARYATTPAADFVVDRVGWVITAAVAVIGALVGLAVFFAPNEDHAIPIAQATVTAPTPTERLNTPAVKNYLAALFSDADIGPPTLTAEQALFLGDAVCTAHQQGTGLYSIADHIQQLTGRKLDSMQTKRLVDAADRNLCTEGK